MADQDSLVRRVQALYAKAESTTFEGERDSFLAKADQLVRDFALEAALADAAASKEEQETVTAEVVPVEGAGIWSVHVRYILSLAAKHNDVFPISLGGQRMHLIGFKQGIDFTQMLYATLQIHFLRNLQPGWDPSGTFEYNVYMLKTAGVKWRVIAYIATEAGHPVPWSEKSQDGKRLINAYKRYCAANGIEATHQTQSHEDYREAFASAYVSRLRERLEQIKGDYDPDSVAQGAGLALRSRMDRVMDEVYRLYPHLHPVAQAEAARKAKEESDAWWAGLTDAQKKQYTRPGRTVRETEGRRRARYAGYSAGETAANAANINPGSQDLATPSRKAIQ